MYLSIVAFAACGVDQHACDGTDDYASTPFIPCRAAVVQMWWTSQQTTAQQKAAQYA